MNKTKRPILGVVAAEANSIEQRQILKGIVEQAQEYTYDTAVFSNIYNPNVTDKDLACENKIYELVLSREIDAVILIAESFVNEALRKKLADYLSDKNVPVIIVGSYLKEFDCPDFRYINTNDESDIEEVTSHLIESHNFTDIDLLTGYDFIEASNTRVNGYRNALRKHGLPVNENKIHFGDFWINSGQELADKYINGELPMPQAIVCTNDYMAYGILDRFAKNDIDVPDKVSIIGYEYIDKRTLYSPLLTTYQRNRSELGKEAVRIIHRKLLNLAETDFIPPKGMIVTGDSCPCGKNKKQFYQELDDAKTKKDYEFWNLFGSLEHDLTESRNLDEFINITGSYQWLIRGVNNVLLCLHANWYETDMPMSDNMTCRSIMPWLDSAPFEINKHSFSKIFDSVPNSV